MKSKKERWGDTHMSIEHLFCPHCKFKCRHKVNLTYHLWKAHLIKPKRLKTSKS